MMRGEGDDEDGVEGGGGGRTEIGEVDGEKREMRRGRVVRLSGNESFLP